MTYESIKIAIIVSQYNREITDELLAGCLKNLMKAGIQASQIDIVSVPGAVEIPLLARLKAKTQRYHAIICLGSVIRGETDHYDYVCQQVSQGCQQVMLEFEIPVIFGILTTHSLEQAKARTDATRAHKGIEAAEAALTMIKLFSNHHLK